MKRAILLLTAALLGTSAGCGSTCDFNDVALYWHFQDPAGGGELTCAQAGVAKVAIYIDGNYENTFDCVQPDVNGNPVQGVTLTYFDRHFQYQFEVDGLDANGSTIYADAFTYTSSTCGLDKRDSLLVSTVADMTLTYQLLGGAAGLQDGRCATPTANSRDGQTYIWFELLDQNGNVYTSVGPSQSGDPRDETLIPCSNTAPSIVVPGAPYGGYTVSRIQEVDIQRDNTIVVFRAECPRAPAAPFFTFQHAQPNDAFSMPGIRPLPVGSTFSCWR